MAQPKKFASSHNRVIHKRLKDQLSRVKLILEISMLHFEKFLQKLWETTLASDLYKRDKAEILRFMIFAITIIVVIALFVLNP